MNPTKETRLMARCACQFTGPLDTRAHRVHHREWETQQQPPDPGRAILSTSVAVEHDQRLDELVAWAHGGPPPELTPGAQARLARAAQEERR